MSSIIENQITQKSIEAGTAFRHAYHQAKNLKAALWITTLGLATTQLSATICNALPTSGLYLTSVVLLGLYILFGSFGKDRLQQLYLRGCTIQRYHDFLTMEVGKRPNALEMPQATITKLSTANLKKHPNDKEILANWWSSNLAEVPFNQARLISVYSSISWETELRKQYKIFLFVIFCLSLIPPIGISIYSEFTIEESIILAVAPCTPFIGLLLEEILTNRRCHQTAANLLNKCNTMWENTLQKKLEDAELRSAAEDLLSQWQTYRATALPIFEWLYNLSRTQMEKDMIINTDSLIEDFKR